MNNINGEQLAGAQHNENHHPFLRLHLSTIHTVRTSKMTTAQFVSSTMAIYCCCCCCTKCIPLLAFFFRRIVCVAEHILFFFFVVGRAASLNGLQPVMFVRMLRFWEMHALLRCCDGVRAFVVFVSAWKFACQRLCNVNLTNTPNARAQWKRDYATGTERDQQHTTTAKTTKF